MKKDVEKLLENYEREHSRMKFGENISEEIKEQFKNDSELMDNFAKYLTPMVYEKVSSEIPTEVINEKVFEKNDKEYKVKCRKLGLKFDRTLLEDIGTNKKLDESIANQISEEIIEFLKSYKKTETFYPYNLLTMLRYNNTYMLRTDFA